MRRDKKEVAEHLMLVDLGRNDLGRVANSASVKVDHSYDGREIFACAASCQFAFG